MPPSKVMCRHEKSSAGRYCFYLALRPQPAEIPRAPEKRGLHKPYSPTLAFRFLASPAKPCAMHSRNIPPDGKERVNSGFLDRLSRFPHLLEGQPVYRNRSGFRS